MRPAQKRITIALWGLVVLAMVGMVVGKILLPRPPSAQDMEQREQAENGVRELYAVPAMALTDQTGNGFDTRALRGKPWVADFIFTTCGSVCPMMSTKMAELQKLTPAGVQLVSFTVDPANDTPAVLKAYGQSYHADFSRWHFLTGSVAEMADAAYQMKISVKPAAPGSAIMHSDKFLLVNAGGSVVGVYDGANADEVKRLAADATKLAQEPAAGKVQ